MTTSAPENRPCCSPLPPSACRDLRAPALDAVGSPEMTDDQVQVVKQAMIEQGVVASVEHIIDGRVNDAVTALDTPNLSAEGVAGLIHMLTNLTRRTR